MNDILLRAELRNPEQARAHLRAVVLPWIGEQLAQGRELVLEARLREDEISDAQRGYLHGVVLRDIAAFARPNGEQFPLKTWKEHFRAEWLGFKRVTYTDPMTGKKSRRRVRVSTEDLGVRRMAEYIDRMIAFAATDLGVVVSEPLPPHLRGLSRTKTKRERIDAETGEILEVA